jgi:predicted anti-sigma-YlaC factor YlaD
MTCDEVRDRIDDYVDGELPEAEFQETELHLARCEECRAEERAVRAVVARAAALPREVAPARDLWPEVAVRLGTGEGLRVVAPRPRFLGMTAPGWAAAAAVILAAGAWLARERGPAPMSTAAVAPTATTMPVSLTVGMPAVLEAEREYQRAAATLMAALDDPKAGLAPETRAALNANLETIDAALAQVRAALQKDPQNAQLARLLTSTHQKKIGALQRMVRLNRL